MDDQEKLKQYEYEITVEELRWEFPKVPQHTRASFARLLVYGFRPGDFLSAVISNDLAAAVSRADEKNLPALGDITRMVYTLRHKIPTEVTE